MIGHVWGDEESGRTFSVSAGLGTVAVGWQFRRDEDGTSFVVLLGPVALLWWRGPRELHVHVPPIDARLRWVGDPIGPEWVPCADDPDPAWCHAPDGWTERDGRAYHCNACAYSTVPGGTRVTPHPPGTPR